MGSWRIRSGIPPANPRAQRKIPNADQHNGDEIREINIHLETIDLPIQQKARDAKARERDQVEAQEAFEPSAGAPLPRDGVAESPQIVPNKVVHDRRFGGEELAQVKPEYGGVGPKQQVEEKHIDDHTRSTHEAESRVTNERVEGHSKLCGQSA
jgi:hypothetical protein